LKIYTKRGDQGETSLLGNVAASKASPRVTAYGEIDELNAVLGVCRALAISKSDGELDAILAGLQSTLFDVGAELATPPGVTSKASLPLGDGAAALLESIIDRLQASLEPQKHFVLPGGSPAAALLHQARTVCRRAERTVVALGKDEPVAPNILIFLNRLSDLLFVMARTANARAGMPDVPWIARRPE
jgi:cob(I)alamin adenosyltransferase